MKKIIVIVVVLVGIVGFLNIDKIQDAFFGSDLPEPTSIVFEKQLPLFSYNWNLVGRTGSSISFMEYGGRDVIVNYWSPNVPESVEELKIWAKLYEDYKDKVFFIFVTNDSQQDVNKFLQDTGYLFPVYYSGSTPLKSIVLDKAPKTYLITKKGRVVVDYTGAANWNSDYFRNILDGLIKKKFKK
ncbi:MULTISPECIES: TlpA family protein disulfide reductase [Flavobacterium]|uniref:TlpA family protein disulfide reductase n=1 Tax=Flavobacterium TaxID=237 RepID=UPI001FCAA067|nr:MULTISPECIES: TlpA disulfide reductase family protein [Flavobacterium]UOK42556.1 TlpA family protein disulfide reductase [Flavobacterium enshiense]